MKRVLPALLAGLIVLPVVLASGMATGASSSVTVTMTVPSSTSIVNLCTGDPAVKFGVTMPGTNATTATGAGVCRFEFGSSNDTAQLRLAQRDRTGTAMGRVPQGSWTTSGPADGEAMSKIRAFGPTLAFAVGRGYLWRTTDTGATWTRQAGFDSWNWHRDVEHAPGDATTWWVAGGNGRVGRTTNATAATPSWDFSPTTGLAAAGWPSSVETHGVAVASANVAWVVGGSGWVGKTTDGGATWVTYQIPGATSGFLRDVDALDANRVMIGGWRNAYSSTGGGSAAAWTVSQTADLFDVRMVDATFAWGSGGNGAVVTWNGSAWTTREVPAHGIMYGVTPLPADPRLRAVAVGVDGEVFTTADAGVTWQRRSGTTGSNLWSVESFGGGDLVAVGSEGTTIRSNDGGASWTLADQKPTSVSMLDVAAAPANGRLAVAVGSAGVIRRTADGGSSWTAVPSGETAPLFSATFGSDSRAWAVGAEGLIIGSSDGGLTWSRQHFDAALHLQGVAAASATNAVAVGAGGQILRTANGGTSWIAASSGVTTPLFSVAATSATSYVAVGLGATILRSSDAGATWTRVSTSSLPNNYARLQSVTAASASLIYASSAWQGTWRSQDGGTTWTSLPHPFNMGYGVRDLSAAGDTLWAVADWGARRYSRDRGATWSNQSSPTSNAWMRAIHAVDDFSAFLVSDYNVQMSIGMDAASAIPDYGINTWASATTESLFGACLQSLGASTAVQSWTRDADGTCTTATSEPWNALPSTPVTIASTAAGVTGSADIVWGFRPGSGVAPGTYSASVSAEVVAPAAL